MSSEQRLLKGIRRTTVVALSALAVASVGAVALATVFAFDAVASGRASPFVVVVPPAALSVFAWLEYLRSAWLVPSK